MPTEHDWCLAVKDLVAAVYFYTMEHDGWECPLTPEAQKEREQMDQAARKLGLGLIGRPFNRQELNMILDWEDVPKGG